MFHIVPLLQAGRSLAWIAWWSLATVAVRVIMVRLYDRAGRSVFLVSLFHAMINVSWQAFPVQGSFYDPKPVAAVLIAAALIWHPAAREGRDAEEMRVREQDS
jgi:hypothetical protein